MKKKSVIQNYLYNIMYQIVVIIIPLVATPYISRILKPEGIGAYSYTASIVSYFTLFAGLGLSMYGQREIAYHQNNLVERSRIFKEVIIFRTLTVIITLIIYISFIFLVISDKQYKTLLQIQILAIISVWFDISWFFQGIEQFNKTVIRNCLVKVLGLISIFTFVHKEDDLWIYTLILVVSVLIGNISLWFYLPRYITLQNTKKIRPFRNTRTVFELFAPMIATTVYNVLDKTMIGFITKSNTENGYYEQTTKIIAVTLAILTSLGVVLLPRMANTYAEGKVQEFKKLADYSYRFIIWASCPICFGVMAISSCLVPWFLGNGFEKVSVLLKIYSLVLLFIPVSNIAGAAVLTPSGRQNKGTKAVFIGAGTNFALNIVLIRRYLSIGAAVATITAEFVVAAIHLYYIREDISIRLLLLFWIKHVFISCIMAGVILLATPAFLACCHSNYVITNLLQIIVGVALYMVLSIYILKDKNVLIAIANSLRQ